MTNRMRVLFKAGKFKGDGGKQRSKFYSSSFKIGDKGTKNLFLQEELTVNDVDFMGLDVKFIRE